MNAGRYKQSVAVEQYDGAAWQPYFDWYCMVTQLSGGGEERTFTVEGRWREEFETMAGLDHHSEGFRLVWQRSAEVQRKLVIDEIVIPEDRGEPLVLTCHEIVA